MNTTMSTWQSSYTVVIPCYNAEPFLREALDSVLAQTVPPLEVIVVDDGSTDASAAIAESYGPPVRVIRQENQGESVARNRGMDEAKGEWIAFLDADDVWKPEKMAIQLELAQPGVSCVLSGAYTFGNRNVVVGSDDGQAIALASRIVLLELIGYRGAKRSMTGAAHIVVKGSTAPRFPEWTQWGEDLVFLLDVMGRGETWLVPSPLVGVRIHDRNQSRLEWGRLNKARSVLHWLSLCQEWIEPDERRRIRAIIHEMLASRAAMHLRHGQLSLAVRYVVGLGLNFGYLGRIGAAMGRVLPHWGTRLFQKIRITLGCWRRTMQRVILKSFGCG